MTSTTTRSRASSLAMTRKSKLKEITAVLSDSESFFFRVLSLVLPHLFYIRRCVAYVLNLLFFLLLVNSLLFFFCRKKCVLTSFVSLILRLVFFFVSCFLFYVDSFFFLWNIDVCNLFSFSFSPFPFRELVLPVELPNASVELAETLKSPALSLKWQTWFRYC